MKNLQAPEIWYITGSRVTKEHMEDLAEIAGRELAVIDNLTELRDFKRDLRQNEIYYHLAPGLGRL
jgi:L-arabinose isomerase